MGTGLQGFLPGVSPASGSITSGSAEGHSQIGTFLPRRKGLSSGPGPLHSLDLNRYGDCAHVAQMCAGTRCAPLEGRIASSELAVGQGLDELLLLLRPRGEWPAGRGSLRRLGPCEDRAQSNRGS